MSSSFILKRALKQGFQEEAFLGAGEGESGFESLAKRHEFVDFGDDAPLLSQRR